MEKNSICRRRALGQAGRSRGPGKGDKCEWQLGKPAGRLLDQPESPQPPLLLLNVGHIIQRAAAGPAGPQARRAPFPLL